MFILRRRFIYLLLALPFYSLALGGDSTLVSKQPVATTHYFYQDQFGNIDSAKAIESSLTNFQNYLPFNHLGNSGLAYNDLVYYPNLNQTSGFNYYKNNYATYFFSPSKIKYYTTRSPYTNLFYTTGSKKEQIFRLTFSYNIKKTGTLLLTLTGSVRMDFIVCKTPIIILLMFLPILNRSITGIIF